MNTTKNTHTTQTTNSIYGSLKSLGRGIVVTSAVAVMGVSTMATAEASAAGVATGIRHTSTATPGATASATNLELNRRTAYVIRDGKLVTA